MKNQPKIVALVPMKGHSARVPQKNIRPFLAEPLFFRILHALHQIDSIASVVINTDSPEIAAEAQRRFDRVHIINRPAELCGDDVSMNKILAHDLTKVDADLYLQTHSTNPLLRPETIRKAIEALLASPQHDSLMSVNRYQSRFYKADGTALNHDPDVLLPTQELAPLYEENSCLYLFTKGSFASTGRRVGRNPLLFATPPIESIDIDDMPTWELAEAVAAGLRVGV